MFLLLIFAFASGFATALTPCVLPILPIVLSSTVEGGKRRPLGVIVGLISSFTFFTLALNKLIQIFHLPPDLLRNVAIVFLFVFGLSMLVPKFQEYSEKLFSKLSGLVGANRGTKSGFWGGVLIGLSVGLLWVPCAGPILASVIALAVTSTVTVEAVLITLAYISGSSIVLLLIAYGGQGVVGRFRKLNSQSSNIQKVFGGIIVLMAFVLLLGLDRKFNEFLIKNVPQQWLTPLGKFETSETVTKRLDGLRGENVQDDRQNSAFDAAKLLNNEGKAPEFVNPTIWLNTDGKNLTMAELKGKVVLIDFWTYSCINCIRTLPYLRSWYEKYQDKGFVIVGVHSPEFAFEKVQSNVENALKDFKIKYPVMMDNDFETWQAYDNRFWPAHYLVDAKGVIRRHHFGEGGYEEMEKSIQLLLTEKGAPVDYEINKIDLNSNLDSRMSPETYLGYKRISEAYGSNELKVRDAFAKYTVSSNLPKNKVGFSGDWKLTEQFAEGKKGSVLQFAFGAKQVNLVMSKDDISGDSAQSFGKADSSGDGAKFFCNEHECVGDQKTGDLRVQVRVKDKKGKLVKNELMYVSSAKLYELYKSSEFTEGTVELELLDDGVKVYAFTFG